jgi:hypothetical protein
MTRAQSADSWKWQAVIYGYFPSIGGKTKFPQGGGSDVGIDQGKVLDSLNGAFMGSLEANNGRWGAFTDLMYMDLGASKSGIRDLTVGGAPLPVGAAGDAHLDLKGSIWTLAGTYRALADPVSTVDVVAGARMFDMKSSLSWQLTGNVGAIPLPGRAGARDVSMTNWDAIVGVKGRVALGQDRKWFVPYYADVGTGNSELTWQAMTGIGYSFKWGDVIGAWRYLDYKMKSGQPIETMNFNGPAIAAAFRW